MTRKGESSLPFLLSRIGLAISVPLLPISDAVHCIRSRSALQPSPQCTASVLAVHCLHRERKGTLLQNTSSAQPWNANDRFEGLDWTHIYIIRYGLGYAMAK